MGDGAGNGRGPMFGVTVCSDALRSWVTLTGELDMVSAPRLEQVLNQVCRGDFQEIVLDLAGLDFLSAIGLELFVHADEQLRAAGGQLVLNRPGPLVRRVLAITELDTVLTTRPVISRSLSRSGTNGQLSPLMAAHRAGRGGQT
jgi:stage II sporulation protein AA (anti-sigma F factor antagonist)